MYTKSNLIARIISLCLITLPFRAMASVWTEPDLSDTRAHVTLLRAESVTMSQLDLVTLARTKNKLDSLLALERGRLDTAERRIEKLIRLLHPTPMTSSYEVSPAGRRKICRGHTERVQAGTQRLMFVLEANATDKAERRRLKIEARESVSSATKRIEHVGRRLSGGAKFAFWVNRIGNPFTWVSIPEYDAFVDYEHLEGQDECQDCRIETIDAVVRTYSRGKLTALLKELQSIVVRVQQERLAEIFESTERQLRRRLQDRSSSLSTLERQRLEGAIKLTQRGRTLAQEVAREASLLAQERQRSRTYETNVHTIDKTTREIAALTARTAQQSRALGSRREDVSRSREVNERLVQQRSEATETARQLSEVGVSATPDQFSTQAVIE